MAIYYAIVEHQRERAFGVSFPDLPSVFSAADRKEDVISNAVEALRLWEEDQPLPAPSILEDIQAREDVMAALAAGATLISISLDRVDR